MPAIAQAGVHTGIITTAIATIGAVVAAGKLQKVSYIRVANLTATDRTVDVSLYDGSAHHYLCQGYPVKAKGVAGSVVNIVSAPTFLPAGWTIRALASAASALDLTAPYLETAA